MAWLEQDRTDGPFQLIFRFGNQRVKRSTGTKNKLHAQEIMLRVKRRMKLIEQGELQLPTVGDPVAFLMGRESIQTPVVKIVPTLKQATVQYLKSFPAGAIEENTRTTLTIHLNHLCRVLGSNRRLCDLNQELLQQYVTKRTGNVSPETAKKEIATAARLWKFGVARDWISGPSPTFGLNYPKSREKPPFQTASEIRMQVLAGNLSKGEEQELWDALFLTTSEIERFLDHVKKIAQLPFLFPMIATAAHSGARRSELLRSEVRDIDLNTNYLTLREKKRKQGRLTTRRVPLSARLRRVLKQWLENHPGSKHTFCLSGRVPRSRSHNESVRPLTVNQAHNYFEGILTGEWQQIKGWHVLRHSFASNCAAAGVDQRVINEWMGHQTEEMVRRYRHLLPDHQRSAIEAVFRT